MWTAPPDAPPSTTAWGALPAHLAALTCRGLALGVIAECVHTEPRPLPGPSDADRAGELSFGRLELGGPTSSRFSAIAARLVSIVVEWDNFYEPREVAVRASQSAH